MNFNHFIKLIDAVCKHPAVYSINRVEEIDILINGYLFGTGDKETISDFMSKFNSFVVQKFDIGTGYNWVKLIRLNTGGDLHTIELFDILYNEFKATRSVMYH